MPLSELPNLIEEVKSLTTAIAGFDREARERDRKSRRDNWIIACAVFVVVISLSVMAFFVCQQNGHVRQLQDQQEQTQRIRASTCGFYELALAHLLGERDRFPGGPERFDAGVQSLKDLMAQIRCAPNTDAPPASR